jgi:hypothetical protein
MNERLLQFIWQFQYFNRQSLCTTTGEPLVIEKPGTWNHHQGPDFSAAMIRIGNTKWIGNIELHLRSSDWNKHEHHADERYHNIILHVVWEDDLPLRDQYDQLVHTLVLGQRIPRLLLERYEQMMHTVASIPCFSYLPALSNLAWAAWKERLAAERLERRSKQVLEQLQQSGGNWEETCWQQTASGFGIRVNADLFEMVARSLPLAVLGKHRNQLQQLEALLMGQANLLAGRYEDAYAVLLQREYRFLRKKYQLQQINKQPAFLRMRPAAFPTLRLAQLAVFLQRCNGIFALIKESAGSKSVMDMLMVTANDYWHYHYVFDEETVFQPKQLGKQMAVNILINSVIPVLFAYGLHTGEQVYRDRAIRWLYELPPEQNQLTKKWKPVTNQSALDSQALIELTNNYCTYKRCLDCAVGNKILKNDV